MNQPNHFCAVSLCMCSLLRPTEPHPSRLGDIPLPFKCHAGAGLSPPPLPGDQPSEKQELSSPCVNEDRLDTHLSAETTGCPVSKVTMTILPGQVTSPRQERKNAYNRINVIWILLPKSGD